jgi:putative salt-induced outer membrane protein YdiY
MRITFGNAIAAALLAIIAAIHSAYAATVSLTSGDRLSGSIVSATPEAITLKHPLLGELVLPRDEIATLIPDPEATASAQPVESEVAAQVPDLLDTSWFSDWKQRLTIGVTGAAGKSENQKINASYTAEFEDENTRWSHETAYYRNEDEGSLSDNSFKSLLNRDWLQPGSPWFEFAGVRFDWDEFQDWDTRFTGNGGVGYEFVSNDRYRLLGRAGLGANQTFGDREEFTIEGLLEIDATWRISAMQTLAFTNTFHPSLTDSGEYRNLTTLAWTLDLNEASGLGMKIGLSNDYDSLGVDASDKNDFKYTAALVWEL